MKAVTVLQPWAALILTGAKRIETRSWRTRHRGPLLIHAGRRYGESARALYGVEPFRAALTRHGFRHGTDLPRGALLGVVDIVDCVPAEALDVTPDERAFGDYRPGRWAWLLERPRPLPHPVPWRGTLALFDVDDSFLAESDPPSSPLLTYARPLAPELSRTA